MLGKAFQPEIEEMIRERQFDLLRDILTDLETADIGEIIEDLPEQDQGVVFRLLPRDLAADVFEYLSFDAQEYLLKNLSNEDVGRILNEMAPDDRTRLLEELPGGVTQRLLKTLDPAELKVARTLLGYPEESIGRLMTPEYVAARPDWSISQTLEHIRKNGRQAETLSYIYVTDAAGALIDDISLGRIVMADPGARLSDLTDHNVVSLSALEDREEAVVAFKKYDRSALPVVDSRGVLVGIVTVDDVLDVEESEATEDVQIFGAQAALEDGYFATSAATIIRKRVGWLTMLFVGGFLTSWAMQAYDGLLHRFLFISFFVPLVISSGGNSGSQSAAMIVRGLAIQELELRDWLRVLLREAVIGLSMGMILGLILATRVLVFPPADMDLAARWPMMAVMWLAVTLIVTLGAVMGGLLPFFFKRLGFDPAVSSGPFIATFIDFSGLMIYLTLALWLLSALGG